MSSIHGFSSTAEMMFAQQAASKSGSPNPGQTGSNVSASQPADTVVLSLNAMRDEFQNFRISSNERNGNLTSAQATQLQSQIATVEQQVTADRQANGGMLTSAERVSVNQMQNQISQQIHDMAHNITPPALASIPGFDS